MHLVGVHFLAQRGVHPLVPRNGAHARKGFGHDHGAPVAAIAFHAKVGARKACGDDGLELLSVHGVSASDFVADAQKVKGQGTDERQGGAHHRQADPRRDIALAKKAITKAIDHVEKRVQVAELLPKRRQGLDGIKHTRQKRHGHDDEVLEGGHLVELFSPQPGNHAQRAHHGRAHDGKGQNPQRVHKRDVDHPARDDKHAQAHGQAAHHRRANIGNKPTFGNHLLSVEIHIFDFHEDIYNKKVKLLLYERIRDEIAFNNVNDLIEQLKKDKSICQNIMPHYY